MSPARGGFSDINHAQPRVDRVCGMRGCHIIDTMIRWAAEGSRNVNIPERSAAVWRSGIGGDEVGTSGTATRGRKPADRGRPLSLEDRVRQGASSTHPRSTVWRHTPTWAQARSATP